MINTTVSTFERDTALQRLGVVDHGFRFHSGTPTSRARHRIPGTRVAGYWKRDFRVPAEGRMEANAKTVEQSRLARIPNGIALGEWPRGNNETNGSCQEDQRAQGDVWCASSLNPADCGVGDPGRSFKGPLAQSRSDPSSPELATEGDERLIGSAFGPIVSPLACCHGCQSWPATLRSHLALAFPRGIGRRRVSRGPSRAPNVEGRSRTMVVPPSLRSLRRRVDHPTHQGTARRAALRRLARPVNQEPTGRGPSRRLAGPENQDQTRRGSTSRLARPANHPGPTRGRASARAARGAEL